MQYIHKLIIVALTMICSSTYGQIDTVQGDSILCLTYEAQFYYEPPEHKLDSFCVCEGKDTDQLILMKSYIEENLVLEGNPFKQIMYQTCLLNIADAIQRNRNAVWKTMRMPLKDPEEEQN